MCHSSATLYILRTVLNCVYCSLSQSKQNKRSLIIQNHHSSTMMFQRSKRSNPREPKTFDIVTIDCVDYNTDYSEYDADYEQSLDSFRVADYEQSCDPFQVTDNHDNDDIGYNNSSQSSRWASFEGSIRKQLVEESPVAAQRKLSCSMRWIDASELLYESPKATTRRVSVKDLPPQLYARRGSSMSGASISSIPPTTTENENEETPIVSPKELIPQEFTWRRNFGNEETNPIVSMKDVPPQSYTRRRSRLSGASIPSIPSTTPEHEETSQIVSMKDLPPQLSIRRRSRLSGASSSRSSSRMSGTSLASIPDEDMISKEEPEVQNGEQQSIRDRRHKRGQVSELVVTAAIACAELRKQKSRISGASSSRMSGASLASIPDEEIFSEEEPEAQNREQQSIRDRRRKRGQAELVVTAAIACAELREQKGRISGLSSSRISGESLASIPDEDMFIEEEPEVQNREKQSSRDRRYKRGQVSELKVTAAIACAELRKHRGHQLPRIQTKKSPARKNQRCSDTSEDKSRISCYRRQSPVTIWEYDENDIQSNRFHFICLGRVSLQFSL